MSGRRLRVEGARRRWGHGSVGVTAPRRGYICRGRVRILLLCGVWEGWLQRACGSGGGWTALAARPRRMVQLPTDESGQKVLQLACPGSRGRLGYGGSCRCGRNRMRGNRRRYWRWRVLEQRRLLQLRGGTGRGGICRFQRLRRVGGQSLLQLLSELLLVVLKLLGAAPCAQLPIRLTTHKQRVEVLPAYIILALH